MAKICQVTGCHLERVNNGQQLPSKIVLNLANSLDVVGGPVNGLTAEAMEPNCQIKTINGDLLNAVWYLNNRAVPRNNRIDFTYPGVDEKGLPKEYSFKPVAWVFAENNWLPVSMRLLRVISNQDQIAPDFLSRVVYRTNQQELGIHDWITRDAVRMMTSLGAAGNPFNIVYLLTGDEDQILPSPAKNKWLVLDQLSVGYKPMHGTSRRIYGPGCYFGGLWSCANRGSVGKVDQAVCKVKSPPWETRVYLTIIDDLVFNAKGGGSIKSGRMRLLNEDQPKNRIPDWVHMR